MGRKSRTWAPLSSLSDLIRKYERGWFHPLLVTACPWTAWQDFQLYSSSALAEQCWTGVWKLAQCCTLQGCQISDQLYRESSHWEEGAWDARLELIGCLGSQQPALLLHSSGFQFLHQTEEATFASASVVVPDPIPRRLFLCKIGMSPDLTHYSRILYATRYF